MSMARQTILVVTFAAVAAVMIATTGTASAQGNPSCFGQFARTDAGVPGDTGGPGFVVGDTASSLGKAGATDDIASTLIKTLQDARQEACPSFPPNP